MAQLKAQLKSDLTAAIKAREAVRMAALRMTLAAITTEEVSGDVVRELGDDEVRKVITREVKKRKEAAEAFDGAGRTESAATERAESAVLSAYLPAQLGDDELTALVGQAVEQVTAELGSAPGPRQMGLVMKIANPLVAGRAEGSRVAAAVKAALQS
jgi:uncharacterized protein YqeY